MSEKLKRKLNIEESRELARRLTVTLKKDANANPEDPYAFCTGYLEATVADLLTHCPKAVQEQFIANVTRRALRYPTVF